MKTKKSKGLVLPVALIILGVILVIALSISAVSIQERKGSIGASQSVRALQNADTGVEKILNNLIKTSLPTSSIGSISVPGISCDTTAPLTKRLLKDDGGKFTVELKGAAGEIDCDSGALISSITSIKSTGLAPQESRVVEVAVAAGGSPNYGFQCMSGVAGGSFPFCLRWDVKTGAATIRLSGDWALASSWTTVATVFSATTLGQYEVSCTQGNPGSNLPFCVRINVQTGETEFKKSNNWVLSGWTTQTAPFAASTSGIYAVSCVRYEAGYSQDNCCRMDLMSGVSECKGATDGNHTSWVNRNNPF